MHVYGYDYVCLCLSPLKGYIYFIRLETTKKATKINN